MIRFPRGKRMPKRVGLASPLEDFERGAHSNGVLTQWARQHLLRSGQLPRCSFDCASNRSTSWCWFAANRHGVNGFGHHQPLPPSRAWGLQEPEPNSTAIPTVSTAEGTDRGLSKG